MFSNSHTLLSCKKIMPHNCALNSSRRYKLQNKRKKKGKEETWPAPGLDDISGTLAKRET